jgi:hypothetical protein
MFRDLRAGIKENGGRVIIEEVVAGFREKNLAVER